MPMKLKPIIYSILIKSKTDDVICMKLVLALSSNGFRAVQNLTGTFLSILRIIDKYCALRHTQNNYKYIF